MEYQKILFSRFLYSYLWTFILQIFPLSFYILLTNFDVFHPISWVLDSASVAFSFGTWASLIPVHGLIFAIGYVLSQEYKNPPVMFTSRFKFFCSFFTRANLLKWCLYTMLGIALPWTYLKLNNQTLLMECQESVQNICLNESNVFLIACGVWTAVYYFVRYDILVENYLEFPLIRQLKFLQIRSKFLGILTSSFKSSFVPVLYFFPIYMWYGKQITLIFEFILAEPNEQYVLTGAFGFMKFSLFVNAWLISITFFCTIETLQAMIRIHFTEHYSFALIKQPNVNTVLLSTALGEHNIPIIHHLACYDLFILSMSHKSNRWQIFTLSQPGGHPHTWNAILHESLKLIEKYIYEIESIYKVPEPLKPKSPIPRHIHVRDMTIKHEEIITGPVPLSPSRQLRNLIEYSPRQSVREQQPSAIDEVWLRIDSIMNVVAQNSVVNYIFGFKTDVRIRFLLSNCQPLIWVVQSISELSANALLEDQFGIVLKELPLIINTLLQLKLSLEKLGNIQNKFQKRDHEFCMKAALKSALKRSLYRIAVAYSDYLTDLPLSQENLNCMNKFVNFKEC